MESTFVTRPLMLRDGLENLTIVPVPRESILPPITVKILIGRLL